jgi:hypothetical protein
MDVLKRDKKMRQGVMYFAVLQDEANLRGVPKPVDETLVAEASEYLSDDPLFAARWPRRYLDRANLQPAQTNWPARAPHTRGAASGWP